MLVATRRIEKRLVDIHNVSFQPFEITVIEYSDRTVRASYREEKQADVFFSESRKDPRVVIEEVKKFLGCVLGKKSNYAIGDFSIILQLHPTTRKWRFKLISKNPIPNFCSEYLYANEEAAEGEAFIMADRESDASQD